MPNWILWTIILTLITIVIYIADYIVKRIKLRKLADIEKNQKKGDNISA